MADLRKCKICGKIRDLHVGLYAICDVYKHPQTYFTPSTIEAEAPNLAPFMEGGLYFCRHGKDEGSYCRKCKTTVHLNSDGPTNPRMADVHCFNLCGRAVRVNVPFIGDVLCEYCCIGGTTQSLSEESTPSRPYPGVEMIKEALRKEYPDMRYQFDGYRHRLYRDVSRSSDVVGEGFTEEAALRDAFFRLPNTPSTSYLVEQEEDRADLLASRKDKNPASLEQQDHLDMSSGAYERKAATTSPHKAVINSGVIASVNDRVTLYQDPHNSDCWSDTPPYRPEDTPPENVDPEIPAAVIAASKKLFPNLVSGNKIAEVMEALVSCYAAGRESMRSTSDDPREIPKPASDMGCFCGADNITPGDHHRTGCELYRNPNWPGQPVTEKTNPTCKWCGKNADHKCGASGHSCGDCCTMLGISMDQPGVYEWLTEVVSPFVEEMQPTWKRN